MQAKSGGDERPALPAHAGPLAGQERPRRRPNGLRVFRHQVPRDEPFRPSRAVGVATRRVHHPKRSAARPAARVTGSHPGSDSVGTCSVRSNDSTALLRGGVGQEQCERSELVLEVLPLVVRARPSTSRQPRYAGSALTGLDCSLRPGQFAGTTATLSPCITQSKAAVPSAAATTVRRDRQHPSWLAAGRDPAPAEIASWR